jgi:hypothetical protein
MIGAMAPPLVLRVVGHRLHRAGLPIRAAVGMDRDGWRFRCNGGHAHPRHREGGDRKGDKGDGNGSQSAHHDFRGLSVDSCVVK